MPRFSIIIGHYKQLDTLPKLFEALLAQTFQDFEVHFCDDGSFSEGWNLGIPAGLAHRTTIHWQPNKGMRLARNINQGIKAAKGEYCVFIMADSFPEQNYLELLNEWVKPNRVVCGIRYQIHEGRGVDVDWRVKKELVPEFPSIIVGEPWKCLTGNGLTVPTEAFRKFGGWCEELEGYGGDDAELVGRLFFKGYICWSVPDLRLFHHWHVTAPDNPINARKCLDIIKTYAD